MKRQWGRAAPQGVYRTQALRLVGQRLDLASVSAPATGHRLDGLGNHLGLFDSQLPTHREVVKGAHRGRFDHVETRQIAAGIAAIPIDHPFTVLVFSNRSLVFASPWGLEANTTMKEISLFEGEHSVQG